MGKVAGPSRKNKPNPELLAEMTAAIAKASSRSSGEFNGLFGSLPKGTATVLGDIVERLRQYLLDERGLDRLLSSKGRFHTILQRRTRFRITLQRRAEEDEGVRVALEVLESIASVLRVGDSQYRFNGQPLSKSDAIVLLLAGRDGLQHHRHVERQRRYAKEASKLRSEARRDREAVWLPIARALRQKHPHWSNAKLATEVTRARDVSLSVSAVRQALPKHGLSKRI